MNETDVKGSTAATVLRWIALAVLALVGVVAVAVGSFLLCVQLIA